MSEGMAGRLSATFVLFLVLSAGCFPQDAVTGSIRVMFYNAENLFDIYDDPETDDDEFTPQGTRRWTQGRYTRKLNSVLKVILASGSWEPPALIGLCEIENRRVLEDLVDHTFLSKYNYGIIHQESPDARGIDVCLLYRRDRVSIDTFNYFGTGTGSTEEFLTRDILYAKCRFMKDTVHLFINHWPSRRGGVLAAETHRIRIAGMLKSRIDSVSCRYGANGAYIVMGDFNASPGDDVIKMISDYYSSGLTMVNLSETLHPGRGTYRYQGSWEIIDQVIVSSSLLKSKNTLTVDQRGVRIIDNDFLMIDDPTYPGRSPFSTWKGYRYQAGYSDHLPVIIDLIDERFIPGE